MSAEPQYLSQCPNCETQIDVSIFEPFAKIPCPACQASIRVRRKFDHFVIIRQIGEGGMSRVFEAEDETLGRRVALKILHRHYSRDRARMAQFQTEALITARVTHPNVIKLYSVGYDQGYFYIAMELVKGGSLEQRIKRDTTVPEKEALRIGRQVADGLRAAFRMGLAHRDVKPANILFTEEGIAKVVDFGLALFVEHEDTSGEIWATPYYVSPEKVIDGKEDFRGDLFSLGATLYHALTGKPPHKADTNSIAELRMIKCRRITLEESGRPFSPRTAHVVDRLLAFKPDDRPATYDVAVDELRLAEGLSDHEMVIGGLSKRRKLAIAGAALLVLAFVGGLLLRSDSTPRGKSVTITKGVSAEALGGDSVTLTAGSGGGKTIAQSLEEARSLLRTGNAKAAGPLFDQTLARLVADPEAHQPTVAKTRFNTALCAIINGNKSRAVTLFRELSKAPSDGTTLGTFFTTLGKRLSDDLALSSRAASLDYDTRGEAVLGYLAHGLAQWHLGDPSLAARLLKTFTSSEPRGADMEWLSLYRDLVKPYAQDLPAVATLAKPDAELPRAEADKLIAATQAALAGLKTPSPSRLREQLESQIKRLKGNARRLDFAAQQAALKQQAEHQKREMEQFKELTESLPQLAQGYDVAPVLGVLKGMKFESPSVLAALETQTFLYQAAADFLATLQRDVAAAPWQGRLQRRELGPVEGRVTQFTLSTLTLALDRGGLTLQTPDVMPETFITMARDYLAKISDSDDYYRRAEMIAIFARLQGLQAESESMARLIIEENPACRLRWLRITQGG